MFKEPKPYKARGTFMAFTPILLPRFPAGYHIFSQWTLGPCILCVYLHLESPNLRCCPLAARGVEVVSNRKPRLSIAFPRSNLFFFCSASFLLWSLSAHLQSITFVLKVIKSIHTTHFIDLLIFPTGSKFISK